MAAPARAAVATPVAASGTTAAAAAAAVFVVPIQLVSVIAVAGFVPRSRAGVTGRRRAVAQRHHQHDTVHTIHLLHYGSQKRQSDTPPTRRTPRSVMVCRR